MAVPFSPETVSQETLCRYVRSRNRRLSVHGLEKKTATRIFEILEAGGKVEPGTHDAEVLTKRAAGRLMRYLVVDGNSVD